MVFQLSISIRKDFNTAAELDAFVTVFKTKIGGVLSSKSEISIASMELKPTGDIITK